ncbi:MAG TPA: hypothetical protein VD931_00630 [Baekduia sp.]|nr:hypothetical protein [Baekduia sp.]
MTNVCFLGEVGVRPALSDGERQAAAALGCPVRDPLLVAVDGLGIVLGAAAPGTAGEPVVVVDDEAGERGLEEQLRAALRAARPGPPARPADAARPC